MMRDAHPTGRARSDRAAVTDTADETPGLLATVAWLAVAFLEVGAVVTFGLALFAALALFGWLGALVPILGFVALRAIQATRAFPDSNA